LKSNDKTGKKHIRENDDPEGIIEEEGSYEMTEIQKSTRNKNIKCK